ncbi:hypothetical protein KGM_212144 [Danaus plexippus plexippus]|uniref:Uncharacterized protein n=1 Tax=Danaus plexippus plexippus TaxID=278856 RepID=A0A212F5G4_DANPL|nr:hypothetical protein KGM_212144 [Danaus plexippus plexippus]
MCRHCSNFATFPVYHGLPPTYVYRYRESGGRFSDLLTGLALYNLGRASTDHWQYTHYYKMRPEEKCSMQVIDHKHSEEVPVPCFLLSSFMERSPESLIPDPDALDITSPQIDIRPFIYHNGTTLKVTWEQECVLWRNVTLNREKNVVPCALLKTYSETMKPSGIPVYVWLPSTIAIVIAIYVACQCFFRKKIKKESQPFNQGVVIELGTIYDGVVLIESGLIVSFGNLVVVNGNEKFDDEFTFTGEDVVVVVVRSEVVFTAGSFDEAEFNDLSVDIEPVPDSPVDDGYLLNPEPDPDNPVDDGYLLKPEPDPEGYLLNPEPDPDNPVDDGYLLLPELVPDSPVDDGYLLNPELLPDSPVEGGYLLIPEPDPDNPIDDG